MNWNGEELDLDAYLARTGFTGDVKPDLETLRALHRAHIASIPFENLEIMLGRPVDLDLAALQAKLVRQRRGGYCYEQNLLFAAVLERIGYPVKGLGARVRVGATSIRAVTHMLTRVTVEDGQEWLCDVGFGAQGLREPIPLRAGIEIRQGPWTFGLVPEDSGVLVLRSLRPGGWEEIYAFTLEERHPVDYVVMNHYTSTHPRSAFTHRPVVQRAAVDTQRSLIDMRMSVEFPDGTRDERDVREGELMDLLAHEFGIELSDEDAARLIWMHDAGA
ncbi:MULTISPECIES: arylamine N-acetyltransferase [Streptomyces]|uniref:arylamine N-acetyltransferase family protein n=1 Tax=Streptomyces TaxID=1883 RepID=UPI001D0AA37B|nr:arylamine N-acetyltransferase [Streptomyces longhuiensis]UDM02565.1 arylamine N-acetyltransferase [Streptomyces longhuiensis]